MRRSASAHAPPSYPDHLRAEVEAYLAALRFAREPAAAGLEEAMRYSLLAGGKRIRPVLALATARALGRDPREVLPLAAALELIHTYSLIHDDLPAMDDDDLRRGRPTCHVRYGEDVAILAGDGLYAEAFRLVLHEQAGEPADVLAAVGELADATGVNGMVGGQYIDVRGHRRRERRRPAPPARAQDRPPDRRVASSAYCCSSGAARPIAYTLRLPCVRGRAGRALPDRRRHPRRDRDRRRPWASRRARTSATAS